MAIPPRLMKLQRTLTRRAQKNNQAQHEKEARRAFGALFLKVFRYQMMEQASPI
jgi:hypothetical protein